jgi:hypothetical protein
MMDVSHGLNGVIKLSALGQLLKTLLIPCQFGLVHALGSDVFDSGNAQSID